MVAGHQRAIVDARAEIARLGIAHDLPRVIGCLEVARDQFAQRQPFGTRDLDRLVDRRAQRSVRHGLGNIVGSDGLEAGIRQANTVVVGASSGDRAEKFEELRGPDDRIGDARRFDEPFLGQLCAEIAAVRQAIGADHRECDVMTDGGLSLRAREIAA